MKSKPTDRYLDMFWSKAVAKKYGNKCAICHREGSQGHHIVKRRYKVTRWLIGNGVWLCTTCHTRIETSPSLRQSIDRLCDESVILWAQYNLKDWCLQHKMTPNEFRADRLKELKEYVNG